MSRRSRMAMYSAQECPQENKSLFSLFYGNENRVTIKKADAKGTFARGAASFANSLYASSVDQAPLSKPNMAKILDEWSETMDMSDITEGPFFVAVSLEQTLAPLRAVKDTILCEAVRKKIRWTSHRPFPG